MSDEKNKISLLADTDEADTTPINVILRSEPNGGGRPIYPITTWDNVRNKDGTPFDPQTLIDVKTINSVSIAGKGNVTAQELNLLDRRASSYETKEINLLNHETNYVTLLNGDDNSVSKVKLSELTRGKITVSDTFDANAQVGDFIFKEV